jgi:hypothetical protein
MLSADLAEPVFLCQGATFFFLNAVQAVQPIPPSSTKTCTTRRLGDLPEGKVPFHVYENWVAEGHKARVHISSCSYCDHG